MSKPKKLAQTCPSMAHNLKRLKNEKIKLFLDDKRTYTGTLKAFDEHMNLVLVNTEENRQYKRKKGGVSRTLGVCFFKGKNITQIEHVLEEKESE